VDRIIARVCQVMPFGDLFMPLKVGFELFDVFSKPSYLRRGIGILVEERVINSFDVAGSLDQLGDRETWDGHAEITAISDEQKAKGSKSNGQ
jgi:hypothetical protein